MRRPQTRIHRGLVGERSLVGSDYLSRAKLRQEYEAEIAPRTEAALRRVLQQVGLAPGSDMGTLKGFPCPPAMVRRRQSRRAPHATRGYRTSRRCHDRWSSGQRMRDQQAGRAQWNRG